MRKKVIIIGAGISGLSAGCYLQMNGYETEIFELNSTPGGLCTSWQRGGYTFDGCLHWLVGSSPNDNLYRLWNELIDMKNLKFIDFEYYMKYTDSNDKNLTFYCDADKLQKEMLEKAPEDKNTIINFIKYVKKFSKFSMPNNKASETYNFIDGLKMVIKIIPFMSGYKKWIGITLNDFADTLKSPLLQGAFKVHPEEDLTALFGLMMFAWMHKKSAGYPYGGSLKFSQLIEKKYLELGGKINYRNKITKINIKNNSAEGIITECGEKFNSDIVISAADGHYTYYEMLDGKYLDKKTTNIYKNFKTFPSYVQVSLGVKGDFKRLPPLSKFELSKPIKIDEKTEYSYLNLRIFNFDDSMAPSGKTSMYSMFVTDNFTFWEYLRKNDKVRYQKEKNRIANEVINAIENKFGNIKANIEEIDVSTPSTVIRYTNNWRGSYEGWLPTKQTGLQPLKKTIKGLNNFYMIGQWIEVGGGVPTALISGRNVTQIICKEDKKKFITTHY